jgi:hypothetical protein
MSEQDVHSVIGEVFTRYRDQKARRSALVTKLKPLAEVCQNILLTAVADLVRVRASLIAEDLRRANFDGLVASFDDLGRLQTEIAETEAKLKQLGFADIIH